MLLYLTVFIHEISGKGCTRAEHEHSLVYVYIGGAFFEKRMANPLFVACVTV